MGEIIHNMETIYVQRKRTAYNNRQKSDLKWKEKRQKKHKQNKILIIDTKKQTLNTIKKTSYIVISR